MSILCTRAPSDCLTSACFWVSSLVTCYLDYLHSVHTTTGNLFPTLRGVNLITTGLLLCKTAICLISGCLSPMGVALDKQCDPLQFFKCWYLYPYLACHMTKTKKGLKVRQNMPDIVDTALLVLNQCSLRCYGWSFQSFAYFGNCCITRGPFGTFS